jgi:hypothetical protein
MYKIGPSMIEDLMLYKVSIFANIGLSWCWDVNKKW